MKSMRNPDSRLSKDQVAILLNISARYTFGGYALCMEPEESKGLQIVLSFPKLYADFVRAVAEDFELILNHRNVVGYKE